MGIERYLVASAVEGVIAQRLVRRNCSRCAAPVETDADTMAEITQALGQPLPRTLKGTGCPHCRFTGYLGRQSLFEVCPITDSLRALVLSHTPSTGLMAQACRDGMITLRESGWRAVQDGITSIEEVMRVTQRV